jgi:hypothetical protein
VRLSLLPFWASLVLSAASGADTDPRLEQALGAVADAAAKFLDSAPRFGAHESLKQKAIVALQDPSAPARLPDRNKDKEIVSLYALFGRLPQPQSLHEVRVMFEIDGKVILTEAKAWDDLKEALLNDGHRAQLATEFEHESLGDTAVDFAQLLLLFRKASQARYAFSLVPPDSGNSQRVGADPALVISFEQQSGKASLHLNEAGKRSQSRLAGQLWVRGSGYLPLRIVLRAERNNHNKVRIRDEVRVDYEQIQGTLLPASVSHRRYLDDMLRTENVYQYSGWLILEPPDNRKK